MKKTITPPPSGFQAIIGRDLYNFSLEPLKFPPNTPIKKPEVFLNYRYILQPPDPPTPLILSYQNVNRFFYKTQFTASSAQVCYSNSDHVCVLDHDRMRCKTCGISLKWCFLADDFKMQSNKMIDFISFDHFDEDFVFINNIRNMATLRKFISYTVDRPLGVGVADLYDKHAKYPIELINELGGVEKMQNHENDSFRILADFENSNIQAYRISPENKDYYTIRLLMRGDTNALLTGFTQWFFFKVSAKKPVSLSFEIMNFRKKMSDYNDKSNTLSFLDFDPEGVNKVWRFMEENVRYFKNPPKTPEKSPSKEPPENANNSKKEPEPTENQLLKPNITEEEFYTLRFTYSFESAKEVLFSLTYPYTYTQLTEFLSRQEKKLFVKGIKEQEFDYKTKEILLENEYVSYTRCVMGPSACGVPLVLLKLTSSKYQDPDLYFPAKFRKKQYIVVIARQHPGEPPSSFVAEGVISFLMSEDPSAVILRTFFVFAIIPMMNPDGVILGNNRTGFSGNDFNRNWRSPNKETEPEVVLVKDFLSVLIKDGNKIAMFFDLHGHSHKKGVFVYSTPPSFLKDWEVNDDSIVEWAKSSLLTNILFNNCRYLCLENCKSMFGKGKDESARMVMCKDFEIQYSYTVETSFSCYIDRKNQEIKRLKIEDFKNIGKDLMLAVLEFHTVIAEQEYAKIGKNAKPENLADFNFNKYLSKVKKNYPEFKNSWKEYFSEMQLQKLSNKLGKFVDLVNENLFPVEKESPAKQNENPVVATEQNLKDFYESNLFDRSGTKNSSPYNREIISNSSSFSSNHDNDGGDEVKMEEREREEHKKILGMMLFHEKDLKKTEKLLKKKAIKKTMAEKQNKNASPGKKFTPGASNKNLIQNSQKNLLFEKRSSKKPVLDSEKSRENSYFMEKEELMINMESSKIIEIKNGTKIRETSAKNLQSYYLPSTNSKKSSIRTDVTPERTREHAKTVKSIRDHQNNNLKSSVQLSSGHQNFSTTASTNFGTSNSKVTSASAKRKIPDFFDNNSENANFINNNNVIPNIETEQSLNIDDSNQNSLFKRPKFNRKSKIQKTIDVAEINIPEEESEWTKRKNSWVVKARPQTATNFDKINQNFEENRQKSGEKIMRIRRNNHNKGFSYINSEKDEENYSNNDVSDHFFGGMIRNTTKAENSFERLCRSSKNNRRLHFNPFIMSKKDIYQLYSFKKPVIMVHERKRNLFKTFTESSAIINSDKEALKPEETIKESIGTPVLEEAEQEKPKTPNQKRAPFHILRKNYV